MIRTGLPPGLMDQLHGAARSLNAQQAGLGTVAHNIANASTPGFSRRDLDLETLMPLRGVDATGVRRATDRNLLRQMVEQSARKTYSQTRQPWLSDVDAILGDLSENGIGASLDSLFASMRTLAATPDQQSARQDVLGRAETLASQVRRTAGELDRLRASTDQRIRDEIDGVNDALAEVARLNRDIRIAEASGGDAGDLRDLRDRNVRMLGERIGARALDDRNGGVIVILRGMRLVQDDRAESLTVAPDPTSGVARVELVGPPGSDVTADLGGALGGLVDVRDSEIPDRMASLDQFAWDLATSVNARHAAGFGLDGVGGRMLFAPPAGLSGAAASLTLDAAVDGNPQALAAALDPTALPGDGRNALEMADLEDQDLALGGTATLSEALAALQADAGQSARSARTTSEREADRMTQLDALRESIAGVSVEEQMLLMSRYQRAYEASARVVAVLDQMLETLVNLR